MSRKKKLRPYSSATRPLFRRPSPIPLCPRRPRAPRLPIGVDMNTRPENSVSSLLSGSFAKPWRRRSPVIDADFRAGGLSLLRVLGFTLPMTPFGFGSDDDTPFADLPGVVGRLAGQAKSLKESQGDHAAVVASNDAEMAALKEEIDRTKGFRPVRSSSRSLAAWRSASLFSMN